MAGVIRVLVVDDSAFVRKVVTQMLSRSPFLEVVGTARDGEDALHQVERLSPDVVTLDLVMSPVDGVTFLKRQMAKRPVPVVICSIAHESGASALDAFDAGAVEFVQKPTALATDRVFEIADELVDKVKIAAKAAMAKVVDGARFRETRQLVRPLAPPATAAPMTPLARPGPSVDIVVIGISTGGPQALRYLIPQLPRDFPVPIAIVQHMPVGYTELYANRLNDISELEVVEARDGELVRPGVVLLAPAGRHMTFKRDERGAARAHLDLRPIDTPHRPSVDVLFRSAAETFGERVLGIVMTGMGNDGLLGAAHIKSGGGRIITESESSCIVYGMPRAVDEAFISNRSTPLDNMAATIEEMA